MDFHVADLAGIIGAIYEMAIVILAVDPLEPYFWPLFSKRLNFDSRWRFAIFYSRLSPTMQLNTHGRTS